MEKLMNEIKEGMRNANIEISDDEFATAVGGTGSSGDAPKYSVGDKVVVKAMRPGVILSVHEKDTIVSNMKYYYTVHLFAFNGYPERDMDVFESFLTPMP